MRLCGVLQRIGLVHLDLDRAGLDDVEQLTCHRDQAFTLGGVGEQRRPGDVERALLREQTEIERLDGGGRRTEQRGDSEWREAVERLQERILADGVIDHRYLLAASDLI